uniref:N-acetyltransferase domain-containing protein n=1 Tax=Chromera velia CCMP2878 TaxID=1169474 RepID=A0A0G4HDZ9_9ALVE|eukprot:Cvel_6499.t1-p1 / transcript=Cvel_6499.t1 / gene=Cvel_6499 / organism=Chromera_velia_CCMP2878 / gene_product=hypothetical protein / transcript_product=hypothetical protein / location=Cvel_scaffold319:8610-15801(+) / protein_length=449 / sequence_SO=supercontig / SO=protein_coding / is_pseudo=false
MGISFVRFVCGHVLLFGGVDMVVGESRRSPHFRVLYRGRGRYSPASRRHQSLWQIRNAFSSSLDLASRRGSPNSSSTRRTTEGDGKRVGNGRTSNMHKAGLKKVPKTCLSGWGDGVSFEDDDSLLDSLTYEDFYRYSPVSLKGGGRGLPSPFSFANVGQKLLAFTSFWICFFCVLVLPFVWANQQVELSPFSQSLKKDVTAGGDAYDPDGIRLVDLSTLTLRPITTAAVAEVAVKGGVDPDTSDSLAEVFQLRKDSKFLSDLKPAIAIVDRSESYLWGLLRLGSSSKAKVLHQTASAEGGGAPTGVELVDRLDLGAFEGGDTLVLVAEAETYSPTSDSSSSSEESVQQESTSSSLGKSRREVIAMIALEFLGKQEGPGFFPMPKDWKQRLAGSDQVWPHITNLIVYAPFRRQGVARILCEAADEIVRKEVKGMQLCSSSSLQFIFHSSS